MNLADIRKKAGEDKKIHNPPPVAQVEEISSLEHESSSLVTSELSHSDICLNECHDFDLIQECLDPSEAENVFINADIEQYEEFSLASPEQPSQPSCVNISLPVAEVPSAPESQKSGSVKGFFNPLATLLAGREPVVEGEEVSSGVLLSDYSTGIEEYLYFRVADEKYALSIMLIKEIIKPREVTEVPRMPGFISGVISLRGVIIPVMDMRMRLSLAVGERTGKERVIVLSNHAGYCGVLVDEVIGVVKIHSSEIEDPPAVLDGIDREFVKGLGRVDNRMLILLNLESILDPEIH